MQAWLKAGWALVGLGVAYLAVSLFLRDQGPGPRARPARKPKAPAAPVQGPVRIVQFYGMPGAVARGERVTICYGVENAQSVRLDPPVEPVQPHWNRCFTAAPEATTTYTLTAEGAGGSRAAASFTIQVMPPAPKILFVELSGKQLRRGEPLTVCYGVEHAVSVRLEPLGMDLKPVAKDCVRVYPPRTLKFRLIARSADGRQDREEFTVTVEP